MGLLTAVALAACGDAAASGGGNAPEVVAFDGSALSLQHLGQDVLRALSQGDASVLEGYRLTEAEHNEVVWPELPAAAPKVNFPVDMAWTNIQARNRSAITRIVPMYNGREPSFRGTECRGGIERFETFVVLTDCWVLFSFGDDAPPLEAQVFKDVLVRGGGHKVFRYYDEEPRSRGSAATD